jgi:hypothetical protein
MDREDVKEEIVSFLPGLSLETLTSLLGVLEEIGVESRADLAFVEAKDLEKYLSKIQCRRLLNGIKNKGKSNYDTAMFFIIFIVESLK